MNEKELEELKARQATLQADLDRGDPRAQELKKIDQQIQEAEQADKLRAEQARQHAKLRHLEDRQTSEAVKTLQKLGNELDALESTRKRINELRMETGKSEFLAGLTVDVRRLLDQLRKSRPELLGLPPLPTNQDHRRASRSAAVKRQELRVSHLKELLKTNQDGAARQELEEAQEDLAQARKALAELK